MVTKSKLKTALAAERGVDFHKLALKKKEKAARKKKETGKGGAKPVKEDDAEDGDSNLEEDESDDEDASDEETFDIAQLDESDSDSEVEMEEKIQRKPKPTQKAIKAAKDAKAAKLIAEAEDDDDEEEEEDEEDIPVSDLEDLSPEDKEDLIPFTRLTINNTTALLASLNRIRLPTDKSVPFATHQTIVGVEPTADAIEDVQDDLKRELTFYSQALDAAKRARKLLKAEGVPFERPNDYFAEMVKDDGQMEKVKAKLIETASAKKASAEARKQRDLKKFGKQVQVAKLQERHKAKRETLDKINLLKRKRSENSGDVGATEADIFDVGVEQEIGKYSAGKGRAPKKEREVRPRRQEEVRQVWRRRELGRHERVQCQADEDRHERQDCQDGQVREEPADCWEAVID
ncbi:eukaryotic rRNA processing protein EBP2-domain-containing protein [Pseudomassariella vexata]|uniref:Eukaryotic rRNA processing protein EBP2-domain-containing protein n=1 Tax=Pseudomassariella vexata TaxID=1141098 RepID=A0A1Y2EJY4_9PEZI|nr:eukaryotic rRNA processing protein EBP2-domain-containing protein [Pseudomassariella vexata]ORY71860.1 eukaryotic rRNA processing protein EBP2-domain-containing protein [Pseudomassariella vexata]